MRSMSIQPGDVVCANKRGRVFHAKVTSLEASGTLIVEPIERNISYRHLELSEITAHWAHNAPKVRAQRASRAQELSLPI